MTTEPTPSAPRVLLHLGFPKCASTSLQREFFVAHPDIHNFGKPRHNDHPETATFIRQLRFQEHFAFAANSGAQQFFADQLDADRLNVFSCEDIAMGPYWLSSQSKTADRDSLLRSLHLLAPQATLLVVLRDQMAILQSIYVQLKAGGRTVLPDFQTWIDRQLAARQGGGVLDGLDYALYLDAVADRFGRDRVIALEFDEIVRDTPAALAALAARLDLSPPPAGAGKTRANTRRSGLEMLLINIGKKLPALRGAMNALPGPVRRGVVGLASGLGRKVPTDYREDQIAALRAHFLPRNDRLRSQWGLGEDWQA